MAISPKRKPRYWRIGSCIGGLALVLAFLSCGNNRWDDYSSEGGSLVDALPSTAGPRGLNEHEIREETDGSQDGLSSDDGDQMDLVDALSRPIGRYLSETEGKATVLLNDGKRLVVNRASGELASLHEGFHCLHLTPNCSGTCYVYDGRWLDVVVRNIAAEILVAAATSVNQGPQSMHSYVDEIGTCQQSDIATSESYIAQFYVPKSFSFPLQAPLTWRLSGATP